MMIMAVTQINQRQLGGPFRVHFRGHWHISGADFFLPWPPLSTQSDFYGPKWVVQVSHTEYYICSTRTYWGHFRPCKVSFSALAERSSLLLRQCKFWKYCFSVIFFKCFVWNVSYALILAAQRQNYMNISLIGWSHLGSLIVKNLRQPWRMYNVW